MTVGDEKNEHTPRHLLCPLAAGAGGWFGWGTNRTTESVLKDEDPQYLQVIEYTKKIEDQILGFRNAAKLYIKQLQNRVNSTQLHELGTAATAMVGGRAIP